MSRRLSEFFKSSVSIYHRKRRIWVYVSIIYVICVSKIVTNKCGDKVDEVVNKDRRVYRSKLLSSTKLDLSNVFLEMNK